MDFQIYTTLPPRKKALWEKFVRDAGLVPGEPVEETVLYIEKRRIIATGCRYKNVLKYIVVDPVYQGEGFMATVVSQLHHMAYAAGYRHLFLYTKHTNEMLFRSLLFYPVVDTGDVLLMESRRHGIETFLDTLPPAVPGDRIASMVMNCNPFTLGHQYLVERAAAENDHVYLFVLSESQPPFSTEERMEMVKAGTAHLTNVTVLPTGPYMVSAATFPTYFIANRDRATDAQCITDLAVFLSYFVPRYHITHRYVGTEPYSSLTQRYNDTMKDMLIDVEVVEIPRLCVDGAAVSASRVRELLEPFQEQELRSLVPETTLDFLRSRYA